MRIIAIVFSVFICAPTFSQDLSFVKSQVKKLSDSSFYGRGYINNGSNIAAEYLAHEFDKIGLQPIGESYFQRFEFYVNTFPKKTTVSCNGHTLTEGYDYIIDPVSGSTRGVFDVVQIDSSYFQSAQSALQISRKGKNAYLIDMEGFDTPEERERLRSFEARILDKSPVILLRTAKLMWTVGRQKYPNALIEVKKDAFCKNPEEVSLAIKNSEIRFEARNIIGKIAGKNSDSSLVITAHYDHLGMMGEALFPGASDNASGTAMLLNFAKYFVANPPKYDVYFIAFAAEEAGLLGSYYFVENPTFPLENIKFLINLDLMGSAADGIGVVNGKLFPDKMDTLLAINKRVAQLSRIKLRGKAANSDHYWFSEAGVPSIFIYTIGNAKAYHDVYDVYSNLDFANYEEVFTLLTEFINTL